MLLKHFTKDFQLTTSKTQVASHWMSLWSNKLNNFCLMLQTSLVEHYLISYSTNYTVKRFYKRTLLQTRTLTCSLTVCLTKSTLRHKKIKSKDATFNYLYKWNASIVLQITPKFYKKNNTEHSKSMAQVCNILFI